MGLTEYPPIRTKTQFVRLYNEGEFGNRSPTWDSPEEFAYAHGGEIDNLRGLYHLRNRVAGGPTKYNVSASSFKTDFLWMTVEKGVLLRDIYVSEMCPTECTLIQGEVMRNERGLYLYYSCVKKPMRDSLREGGREATGLVAKTLLEYYMDVNSYEWLNTLLDRYTGHVVEFTTLSRKWGTVPGYNSLFWEVRKYSWLLAITTLIPY